MLEQPADRTALVENAKPKRLSELSANDTFVAVARATAPPTKELRISYVREAEIVNLVKESLGVTNNRDVGEKTFDYYVQNEGLNG